MSDKIKATVDADVLATITEAHEANDKGMTSEKAILASLQDHGTATSQGGIYVFVSDKSWNVGVMQRKQNKSEADFSSFYDKWWTAQNPKKAANGDEPPAGDRSAFNAWANAGFASKEKPWLREYCDKALALRNVSLSQRGGLINKIVALAKAPTEEEWNKLVPNETGGGQGGGTVKSRCGAVARAIENAMEFGKEMTPEMRALIARMTEDAEKLADMAAKLPTKKAAVSDKAAEKAAKREAARAAFQAAVAADKAKEKPMKMDS